MFLAILGFLQAGNPSEALTQGVTGPLIAPGALPGAVVAFKGAVAIMATDKPVVAAGPVGMGRAVLVGHGAYFGAGPLRNPANARFLDNALRWLGGTPKPRVGLLDMGGIAASGKYDTVNLRLDQLEAGLAGIDVIAMDQASLDRDPAAQQKVVAWLKAGHGMLIAGPAWGWSQLNPGKNIRTDLSANRMLLPFGLGLSGETVDGNPSVTDDKLFGSVAALAGLRSGKLSPAETARATGSVSRTLSLEPASGELAGEIVRQAATEGDAWPITNRMPFRRLQAILRDRAWEEADPKTVKADPSAANFPGLVDPKAQRRDQSVSIDTKVTQWHATGRYAAPGEVITVTIPAEAAGKGLWVRIGPHTDELWGLDKWDRAPSINRRWQLNKAVTQVASPFGGTIFIDVPDRSPLGIISVTIGGAVPAPHFVYGSTTAGEWAKQLAEPGGPWVELEGKKVALSLPRSAVAGLTDPEALMAFWDKTFEQARNFYAAPPRTRPERYCVDRQISAGYMHSGYPIMTFEDVAKTFADVDKLRGQGATWGFFHELGHNFQVGDWTFDGTGEVTNNLFSLYGSEVMNRITPATYGIAHPAMSPAERTKRLNAYFTNGAKFETWKSDPFLALTMYAQVRETFGWEPFTKAFASYYTTGPRPRTELEQHDQWMIRLSRATGRNLGPFFVAWGVPTSDSARKTIADLPEWMPAKME